MKNPNKTVLKAWFIQNMLGLGSILFSIVVQGYWFKIATVIEIIGAIIVVSALTAIIGYFYWPYFHRKLKI